VQGASGTARAGIVAYTIRQAITADSARHRSRQAGSRAQLPRFDVTAAFGLFRTLCGAHLSKGVHVHHQIARTRVCPYDVPIRHTA